MVFICHHSFWLMLRQQYFSAGNIVLLARTEAQFDRLSLGIYREMRLRAEPAARAPEGFSVRFFSRTAVREGLEAGPDRLDIRSAAVALWQLLDAMRLTRSGGFGRLKSSRANQPGENYERKERSGSNR
jgi:hypothetical protein